MKKNLLLFALIILGAVAVVNAQVNVTFNVDMSVKEAEGQFTPGTSEVQMRGDFDGWGAGVVLTDPEADLIYSYEFTGIAVDSVFNFKFFYTNPDTWEGDPNRQYTAPAGGGSFSDYFDRDSVINITADGNILFQVDMSVMAEIGIFDVVSDSVQVRGGFNGWSDGDPARSKMNQDVIDPNKFFLDVPFTSVEIGATQNYKFYVDLVDASLWVDGWERPLSQGGGNRDIDFEGINNQVAPEVWYDDVDPEWVIEDGKNLSVEFRVDMTPATDPNLQAVPFDPATDTLYWIGEQPSFVRSQGWVDTDNMMVLVLTDPDADLIYTATGDLVDPTFNSFQYRYGWKNGSNWTLEPAGFGDFAYRIRYIGQDAPRSFPVNPWVMPIDTWTNAETKTDQETDPYSSLVSVEDPQLNPNTYYLAQNFPNPFNPSTLIQYSVPKTNFVTIKIYNAIGQEVSTLVNREVTAGVHEVNFNANNLSTGVYFYTIKAGDFTSTKKMLLIK
jgi:hypothetical protein